MIRNQSQALRWLCVASLALCACGHDSTAPADGPTVVTLTSAQAAALVSQAQVMSAASPGLAWLTDSIEVVLRAGAQALKISVTVDSVPKTYYAVGLMRQFVGSNPFATFHFIAFNDATNATDFFLTNAYAPAAAAGAPNSVAGEFGGSTAFAHLIHVSGTTVTDWSAKTGTATFERVEAGGVCPGTTDTPSVTCAIATMMMQADVTMASADNNFGDTHTAKTGLPVVPAVLLTFH